MDGDVSIPKDDPRYGAVLMLRLWRDTLAGQLALINGQLAELERPERQRRVMNERAMAFEHENDRPTGEQLHAGTTD